MAARVRFSLLACCAAACLGLALAALPVRQPSDCVNSKLLSVAGHIYPVAHQIQGSGIQDRTIVTVAQNFDIAYGNTYKILSNVGAVNETYVLYQCGTDVPDLAQLGLPANTKVFSVPLTAVSAPDTSVVNIMKLLGVQDRVSYVTGYTVDPCMQLLTTTQCNRSSDSAPPDSVDAIFDFGKNVSNTKAVMFAATADQGPLHGAEYIKFIAAFFNREAVANKVFSQIYDSYNKIYNAVQSVRSSPSSGPSPVLAWVYYQPYYGADYPEQIQIKFHGFRTQYTTDAGAVLPDLETLKSTYVDNTTVKVDYKGDLMIVNLNSTAAATALRGILANVDIVIDESYVSGNVSLYGVDEFQNCYYLNYTGASTELKFLASKGLLRLDGTANLQGTTAWFEEAVARPDVALHDLVYYVTRSALQSLSDTTPPRLVRSLYPSLTAGLDAATGSVNGALVLTANKCSLWGSGQCSATTKPICPAVYLDCSGKLITATDAQPCAPTCNATTTGTGGAAGRAVFTPVMLMALVFTALAAVMGPFCSWL